MKGLHAMKIGSVHLAAAQMYFLACVNDFCHFYSKKKIELVCIFVGDGRCSNKSAIHVSSYNPFVSQANIYDSQLFKQPHVS